MYNCINIVVIPGLNCHLGSAQNGQDNPQAAPDQDDVGSSSVADMFCLQCGKRKVESGISSTHANTGGDERSCTCIPDIIPDIIPDVILDNDSTDAGANTIGDADSDNSIEAPLLEDLDFGQDSESDLPSDTDSVSDEDDSESDIEDDDDTNGADTIWRRIRLKKASDLSLNTERILDSFNDQCEAEWRAVFENVR
jgi:hypothetical protein